MKITTIQDMKHLEQKANSAWSSVQTNDGECRKWSGRRITEKDGQQRQIDLDHWFGWSG